MKKKYTYTIELNKVLGAQNNRKYYYNYRNTKDICITISENAARISCSMTVKFNPKSFAIEKNQLFSDAIKKALLVYLIVFSKNLEVKQALLFVDGEYQTSISVPIYSLISDSLNRNMPNVWASKEVVEQILTYSVSIYDSKIASLFALICAKSKNKETERFMYLWMSINGMYNFISKCAGNQTGNEQEKISMILKMYDMAESALTRKDRQHIAKYIIPIVSENWDNGAITQESLSNSGYHQEIASAIKEQLKELFPNGSKGIEPYACLLIELPYYLRCSYFHASKPILLYAFKDEQILKCLCALNETMEAFLDKELYKYFSGEYSETEIRRMLSKELTHV